jgi:hypothetical protein
VPEEVGEEATGEDGIDPENTDGVDEEPPPEEEEPPAEEPPPEES